MCISNENFNLVYEEKANLIKNNNSVDFNGFSITQLTSLIKIDLEKDPEFLLSKYIIENFEVKEENNNIDILFYSIVFKYYKFVNFLLNINNEKLNITDENNKNIFHYLAADQEFNDLFFSSAKNNDNIYKKDKNGVKPIEIALKNKNMEVFEYILKSSQKLTDEEIGQLFLIAANQPELSFLETFISIIKKETSKNLYHFINSKNEENENALFVALNNKNYEIAHYLLQNGIIITENGNNGSVFERFIHDLKSLNLLFNSGLNANQKNIHGDHPIVFLIKSKTIDLKDKKEIIKFILKKQLNINFKNRNENSFLNYCVIFKENEEIFKFLQDNGAFNYQNIENINSEDIIKNEKMSEKYLDSFNELYELCVDCNLFNDLTFKE